MMRTLGAAVVGLLAAAAAQAHFAYIVPEADGAKARVVFSDTPDPDTNVNIEKLADGKPLADAEVSVLLPGGGKKAGKTDKDGYTEAFDGTGRFGVSAKHIEAKGGEYNGKRYEEARHYATLVVDVGGK